jgi:hypothetical protein
MINAVSAMASSFTILFLFWTITHLGRKLVRNVEQPSVAGLVAILGAGFVGGMAYTFSDSFWFSAVEGEVYASSSFFTAIVFWAILKWENVANEKHATRWILLIAYLMGLSIGIHLLNLLAAPAIVLVYYFKNYKVTPRGIIYSLILSVLILGFLQYGIILWFIKLAGYFELAFVNGFGLPYNTGVIFYLLLVIAGIFYGVYYTHKKKKAMLNTVIMAVALVLIGFSSYFMIVIRSKPNPPMDMNNPETVFDLIPYLAREQYGQRPLLKGHYYNAPIIGTEETRANYKKADGKYVIKDHKIEYVYDERLTTIFPRMYSNDPQHVTAYESWVDIKGTRVQVQDRSGETKTIVKPSFGSNLAFFFKYQVGHMYLRYFMWNFSGRQNDLQGYGGILNGNWISGIKFIDEARLGKMDKLPDRMANHPARNRYFMLPLLLGIIGMFYHYNKHRKDFFVVLTLFILTGIAIVVYLNQKPMEPRERDYSYVGSFYAFAIYIGLGVMSLYEMLKKRVPALASAGIAMVISAILVPGIMASENWDDHDRSGRYTARDLAHNYLNSCAPNAILYTNGDNDLMLFNTEWYIDQMTRQAYESDPVPMSLPPEKWEDGTNNIIYMFERVPGQADLKQVIDFIANEDPRTKFNPQPGMSLDYIPSKKFKIPVDREKILRATTDWDRPIYFVAAGSEGAMNLEPFFQMDGLAYRLVPISTPGRNFLNYGRIDTDTLWDRMMNTFRYGRMEQPDVHLDYYNIRTLSVIKLRNKFSRLASELIAENKLDSAVVALDRCMELMPHPKVPFDGFIPPIVRSYYNCNQNEKGFAILRKHFDLLKEDLAYYYDLQLEYRQTLDYEIRVSLQLMQEYQNIARQHGEEEAADEINEQFNNYYQRYLQERG